MKPQILVIMGFLLLFLTSCTNGQKAATATKINLSATEFADKMKAMPQAPLVDVRTPDEFSKGHLPHSQNINWNDVSFVEQIAALDKAKPVLVYCLSGGRSAAAVDKMLAEGFQEVYELTGGIMKWRSANLPETTETTAIQQGLSRSDFDKLLQSDKLVLIDFYADWCAPCKKMKPYLEEIAKDMADKVVVVRINADDNQTLCKELGIDALPVLQLFKNKEMTWTFMGFIGKEEVVKEIEK